MDIQFYFILFINFDCFIHPCKNLYSTSLDFRLNIVNSSTNEQTNSYIRSFLILKGNILQMNEGIHVRRLWQRNDSICLPALQKNPVALFLHHALTDSLISHVNWMLRCTVARVIDFAFPFFLRRLSPRFSKIDR